MPRIQKSFRLLPGVVVAIRLLIKDNYSFPALSETGVIEKAIMDVWQRTFPDLEFPSDQEEEEQS